MTKAKRILLIMTDQQRWDTIHALGCKGAITPNLDQLTRECTVFEKCYTPSPVCAPARLSMYSGLYPGKHGSTNNSPDILYTGNGMYGMLSEAGYRTCSIGKMHFVRDRYDLHGLKERITQEELPDPSADDYTKFLLETEYDYVIDYNGQRSEMYYIPQISQLPQKYHPTQWIGDKTVEFLEGLNPEEPTFLMASFIHPHPPYAPPVPWNKLHRSEMLLPFAPDNSQDLISYHNYKQNMYKGLSAGVDNHLLTLMKDYYYSCITFVDYQIGRIFQALKKRGLYDDTLIIFTSDHGELLGDYHCLGKRTMLDAVAKVPLLVKYPGKDASHCTDVCSLLDLMPTILNYAGIPLPQELDGQNLFCANNTREFVYSQYSSGTTGLYMIVSNNDKLIYSAADQRYWYFEHFPEEKDQYSPANPRCVHMKKLLNEFIACDCSLNKEKEAVDMEQIRQNYYYTLIKQDSVKRMADEKAQLPPGYEIDLDIQYTWKHETWKRDK